MTSDPSFSFETADRSLEAARTHARNGRLADAEDAYRRILDERPDQVEALRFMANSALARGNAGAAVALLSRAVQADRSNPGVLIDLGLAYRSAQRMDEARSVLELALQVSHGHNPTARLMLANVLELDRRPDAALLHYFRAILEAQPKGQWLGDDSTEPALRNMVRHAMQYVAAGRREWFNRALEPLRTGINAARLGRIETALAAYLGEQPMQPEDPGQHPSFLYLPGLGTKRFPDLGAFAWLDDWSAQVAPLDDEATGCIDEVRHADAREPVFSLKALSEQATDAAATGPGVAVLYQRGMLLEATARRAPRLVRAVDSAPLLRIPGYAPEARIVALPPTTRTLALHGRSNAFSMVVATFAGSAPLLVDVGGESRQLGPAQALVFDPGFEFTFAAGDDGEARALVFDVWNPGVSALERDAVAALAVAAVDFDRRLQDLA